MEIHLSLTTGPLGINLKSCVGGVGAYVDSFYRASDGSCHQAESSGLVNIGDIVWSIDGKQTRDIQIREIQKALAATPRPITLTFRRVILANELLNLSPWTFETYLSTSNHPYDVCKPHDHILPSSEGITVDESNYEVISTQDIVIPRIFEGCKENFWKMLHQQRFDDRERKRMEEELQLMSLADAEEKARIQAEADAAAAAQSLAEAEALESLSPRAVEIIPTSDFIDPLSMFLAAQEKQQRAAATPTHHIGSAAAAAAAQRAAVLGEDELILTLTTTDSLPTEPTTPGAMAAMAVMASIGSSSTVPTVEEVSTTGLSSSSSLSGGTKNEIIPSIPSLNDLNDEQISVVLFLLLNDFRVQPWVRKAIRDSRQDHLLVLYNQFGTAQDFLLLVDLLQPHGGLDVILHDISSTIRHFWEVAPRLESLIRTWFIDHSCLPNGQSTIWWEDLTLQQFTEAVREVAYDQFVSLSTNLLPIFYYSPHLPRLIGYYGSHPIYHHTSAEEFLDGYPSATYLYLFLLRAERHWRLHELRFIRQNLSELEDSIGIRKNAEDDSEEMENELHSLSLELESLREKYSSGIIKCVSALYTDGLLPRFYESDVYQQLCRTRLELYDPTNSTDGLDGNELRSTGQLHLRSVEEAVRKALLPPSVIVHRLPHTVVGTAPIASTRLSLSSRSMEDFAKSQITLPEIQISSSLSIDTPLDNTHLNKDSIVESPSEGGDTGEEPIWCIDFTCQLPHDVWTKEISAAGGAITNKSTEAALFEALTFSVTQQGVLTLTAEQAGIASCVSHRPRSSNCSSTSGSIKSDGLDSVGCFTPPFSPSQLEIDPSQPLPFSLHARQLVFFVPHVHLATTQLSADAGDGMLCSTACVGTQESAPAELCNFYFARPNDALYGCTRLNYANPLALTNADGSLFQSGVLSSSSLCISQDSNGIEAVGSNAMSLAGETNNNAAAVSLQSLATKWLSDAKSWSSRWTSAAGGTSLKPWMETTNTIETHVNEAGIYPTGETNTECENVAQLASPTESGTDEVYPRLEDIYSSVRSPILTPFDSKFDLPLEETTNVSQLPNTSVVPVIVATGRTLLTTAKRFVSLRNLLSPRIDSHDEDDDDRYPSPHSPRHRSLRSSMNNSRLASPLASVPAPLLVEPEEEFPLDLVLELLNPQHLATLVCACLLEIKVVVVTRATLSAVLVLGEWLKDVIQPLQWQHIYSPTLPAHAALDLLACPAPFLLGMTHDAFFECNGAAAAAVPADALILHLEDAILQLPSSDRMECRVLRAVCGDDSTSGTNRLTHRLLRRMRPTSYALRRSCGRGFGTGSVRLSGSINSTLINIPSNNSSGSLGNGSTSVAGASNANSNSSVGMVGSDEENNHTSSVDSALINPYPDLVIPADLLRAALRPSRRPSPHTPSINNTTPPQRFAQHAVTQIFHRFISELLAGWEFCSLELRDENGNVQGRLLDENLFLAFKQAQISSDTTPRVNPYMRPLPPPPSHSMSTTKYEASIIRGDRMSTGSSGMLTPLFLPFAKQLLRSQSFSAFLADPHAHDQAD